MEERGYRFTGGNGKKAKREKEREREESTRKP